MLFEPSPGERYPFSFLACPVVMHHVFLNVRVYRIVTKSVFHNSVLYNLSGYFSHFPPFVYNECVSFAEFI